MNYFTIVFFVMVNFVVVIIIIVRQEVSILHQLESRRWHKPTKISAKTVNGRVVE